MNNISKILAILSLPLLLNACGGGGEVERLCDCGEWVTLIMGEDATVCEECADE